MVLPRALKITRKFNHFKEYNVRQDIMIVITTLLLIFQYWELSNKNYVMNVWSLCCLIE